MQFNRGKFNIGKFNRTDFVTYLAMAGLTGSDGLSSSSVRVQHITINVNGEGGIVAVPVQVRYGVAVSSGSGLIEGAVVRTTKTSVAFIGQGELHSGSIKVLQGQATVGGEGALDADLAIYVVVSAELTGAFDVWSRAEGVGIANVRSKLTGEGDLSPWAVAIIRAIAEYKGASSFFVLSDRTTFPTVDVKGYADLSATPIMKTKVSTIVNGRSHISVDAVKLLLVKGLLDGTSNVEALGGIVIDIASNLTGMGLVEASGSVIILIKSQLDGEGNIVTIPYAIYMPPFITIPTRFLIIDTITLAVIEDTVTKIEFEDNQTKVVFI